MLVLVISPQHSFSSRADSRIYTLDRNAGFGDDPGESAWEIEGSSEAAASPMI